MYISLLSIKTSLLHTDYATYIFATILIIPIVSFSFLLQNFFIECKVVHIIGYAKWVGQKSWYKGSYYQ
jgi:hypothetical protein